MCAGTVYDGQSGKTYSISDVGQVREDQRTRALAERIMWCCLLLAILVLFLLTSGLLNKLRHIPGPRTLLIIGNLYQTRRRGSKVHHLFTEWQNEYGPVFKVKLWSTELVIISGYKALHEALVQKGLATGGRVGWNFRVRYLTSNTGILHNDEPDAIWRQLRKITQRHLKQFVDGISSLDGALSDVDEDMFKEFERTEFKPYDPGHIVRESTAKSIVLLICGERLASGHPLLEAIQSYEENFIKYTPTLTHTRIMLYDWLPWLRFLGLKTWKEIHNVTVLRNQIWNDVKDRAKGRSENHSLVRLLLNQCEETSIEDVTVNMNQGGIDQKGRLTERDAEATCLNLLLAGVTTTSATFYSLINILAHNPDVQEAIADEIKYAVTDGSKVALRQRQSMPYTRAFIYEVLRYTSVVPLIVSHRTVQDVDIAGYTLPRDTQIKPNVWSLHHDPQFWGDPETFRPDRFLDNAGDIITADHPNRKHLMPFGAGARVCVGESLAMSRLFVWSATLIQRFRISPANGNQATLVAANNYRFRPVMMSEPYKVIFTRRI